MKQFFFALLLIAIIGNIGAAGNNGANDIGEYPFTIIDHLLRRSGPGKPEIVDDRVIFTASSSFRKVGIAFAHEGFGAVHWFQKFMIPNENAGTWVKNKPPKDLYRDSGMLFYIYTIPENLNNEIEYRLVIDGLWTQDPLNAEYRRDNTGTVRSLVQLPAVKRLDSPNRGPEGTLNFVFYAGSGETVSVAGSFNNWDPFMYELRETSPGRYTLSIPLPAGTYQYIFFYRGERHHDPNNSHRVYSRDGKTACEAVVE
ncbi:hypothetical protein FACS1894161_0130 [Spirochaetia bacterium]|nr:hypothetical protein FACS1894161_0130 [Spirochaetia bacterium]